MFLSKLDMDMRNPSVRQALLDCQDMHRNLMKGFDCTREQAGLLYRIERTKSAVFLYALSAQMPDWDRIDGFGYRCMGMKDISALRRMYNEGDTLAFSLKASPSKKVFAGRKNNRRIFLKTEEERRIWLERQGEKHGFALLAAKESRTPDWIEGNRQQHHIEMGSTEFHGVLRINHAEQFWNSYCKGFGPGKAYGLGLMLLQRVSSSCM